MTLTRAYSLLEVRSFSEEGDQRVIRGVATTPSTDRMGDIVEPLGAQFKNPVPLLHQHVHTSPVGTVVFDAPTKDGVTFTATLAQPDEAGPLRDRCELAWQEVKAGLVGAVSIGFRTLEYSVMDNGGYRFSQIEIIELSLVTVPANADCTITSIKSLVREQLGASADTLPPDEEPGAPAQQPEAPAAPEPEAPSQAKPEGTKQMTISERKAALAAAILEKTAARDAVPATGEAGAYTAEEREQFDGFETEIKNLTGDLDRLAAMEKAAGATATPVRGATQEEARASRAPAEAKAAPASRKGAAFTRFVMATAAAKGNPQFALGLAEQRQDWADTPEVITALKAATAAGTTVAGNWAQPLTEYAGMAAEFVELLRPQTIIGRIEGMRQVPFNTPILIQTGGALVGWVGETNPKPVGELSFDTAKMDLTKVAGIVVLSDEMVRSSEINAERAVQDDLTAQVGQFLDQQFVDPAVTEQPGVRPASITNGIVAVPAGGASADATRAAVNTALGNMVATGISASDIVVIANEGTALNLMSMRNAIGGPEFSGVTISGGTFEGRPMLTSQSVPVGTLILVKASEIFIADDGRVEIDASREATLTMDNAPAAGAAATFNLWQRNAIGIRAERYINWKRRRNAAVQVITGVGIAP